MGGVPPHSAVWGPHTSMNWPNVVCPPHGSGTFILVQGLQIPRHQMLGAWGVDLISLSAPMQ